MINIRNMATTNTKMNRKKQESLGLLDCKTMVMVIDMQIDTQINRPRMHQKSQENLRFPNIHLIIINMNISPSFLQHNTNIWWQRQNKQTNHKYHENKRKRKRNWESSSLLNYYEPSHFAFVPITTQAQWQWQDKWINRQKQKHTNKGKKRRAERVHAFSTIVKLYVMAMHFVFVVA